jgi:hypothetical protein
MEGWMGLERESDGRWRCELSMLGMRMGELTWAHIQYAIAVKSNTPAITTAQLRREPPNILAMHYVT